MKVTVFGVGYVGLVQAAVLAEVGHHVVCVDIDSDKISALKLGQIPIFEPGLSALVIDNYAAGRLEFTDSTRQGVEHGEVQFIAVGTPPDESGAADVQYVLAVARSIGEFLSKDAVVVNKSTVPVGTADAVSQTIANCLSARASSLNFAVVSNPEFLKEGSAVADCMKPDRIIIGTAEDWAEELMRELYAPFNRNHEKIMVMDVRSAELTKYAANCMLATKISFMNEMANLAECLGADIESVRRGIGSDPRIGYHFIYPGVGYGGSCFPKDVKALINTAQAQGFAPEVLRAVEERNAAQKQVLFKKISAYYQNDLQGKVFALWGLSFKPNTDDMREAPSRCLMEALWQAGATVQAYDPEAMAETARIYGERDDLILCDTKEQALQGANALVVMTEWQAFRAPDFDVIAGQLVEPLIFDGRNVYQPQRMVKRGFTYHSVGRMPVAPPVRQAIAPVISAERLLG
ncbi:UDP-glucose/GDP-mannose dehydrogenase family protein [Gilvimarinus sp. DA14]|uniref:UDP-glucose dehydrogenase family protein n=1 Tax=Gilvimarinus sp. DA14 TaxID=2956798 RepID=UPI0020B7A1D4|nr:UDP-glucose/GDP-mannose dehydrogenase family protein [Gilvimarinus sp. DA14]UTF60749.1 UDP-glucose/GDP-mannose dehydrogenase family protein [Gilvimarinus sp. DA14]